METIRLPQPRKSARVRKWRGKWYLIYWDYHANQEKRLSCEAAGAHSDEQRRELINEYRRKEDLGRAEALKRGGRLAYQTPFIESLKQFLRHVDEQAEIRQAGHDPGFREGLSPKSRIEYNSDINRLIRWLEETERENITTGAMDATHIKAFLARHATERIKRGNRSTTRSGASLNKIRRSLKVALNYLADVRPPLFPDLAPLLKALKPVRAEPRAPVAFTPHQLGEFLKEARTYDRQNRRSSVERSRGDKVQKFHQRVPRSATPIADLFLLLALTGMRLGEALALTWKQVDLEHGRLTIYASKTGRTRTLPLTGAPEGEVAPSLVRILKVWRNRRKRDVYVLAHRGIDKPAFPKSGWEAVVRKAKVPSLSPQRLRQSFTSYAASLGFPPDVEALWLGHSAAVAERNYRAQVLDRHKAESMEEAMGLASLMSATLKGEK